VISNIFPQITASELGGMEKKRGKWGFECLVFSGESGKIHTNPGFFSCSEKEKSEKQFAGKIWPKNIGIEKHENCAIMYVTNCGQCASACLLRKD